MRRQTFSTCRPQDFAEREDQVSSFLSSFLYMFILGLEVRSVVMYNISCNATYPEWQEK